MTNSSEATISVRRFFVDQFFFDNIALVPSGSNVLDLGGNKIQKRGRFNIEEYDLHVVYANLSTQKKPDIQASADSIPFRDNFFDAIICSELLEHVENPESVLREIFRILKPEGRVFITVPFLYRIHADPFDYGRYTDFFWIRKLQEIGFRNINISKQGLYFAVLADFFKQYLSDVGFRRPFGRIMQTFALWFQAWALKQERKDKVQANPFFLSFSTGFGIIAVKRVFG